MLYKHLGILLSALVLSTALSAQSDFWTNKTLSLNTIHGNIVRHTSRINMQLPPYSWASSLSLTHRTTGRKAWQAWKDYPSYGATLLFQHYNSPELGQSVGGYAFVQSDFIRKERFELAGRFGLGLGWISAPYDLVQNPGNDIIGSHVNLLVALRMHAAWQIAPRWQIRLASSFVHYSNAASRLPNLGINLLGGELGLAFRPKFLDKDAYQEQGAAELLRRWRAEFNTGMGMRAIMRSNGRNYGVLWHSLQLSYLAGPTHRWKLGIGHEFDYASFAFMSNLAFLSLEERRQGATRWMIFAAYESFFGRFSFNAELGTYISTSYFEPGWFIYVRPRFNYYFRNPLGKGPLPYMGLSIKAHEFVAEYPALHFGIHL